jgi:hypothetical protein
VFPNPSSGTITIRTDQPVKIRGLDIIDQKGKSVLQMKEEYVPGADDLKIDLGKYGITPGIYIIRLKLIQNIRTRKIVLY